MQKRDPKRRKTHEHISKGNTRLPRDQEQALAILYDEVFMQPWFIPKEIYFAMRRLLPNIHLMKLRHYFDDYGCLRCSKSDVPYGASGFCHACNVVVRSRILAGLKKRLKKAHVKWKETVSDHFFDQMNLAQLILYGAPINNRKRSLGSYSSSRLKQIKTRFEQMRTQTALRGKVKQH